LRVSKRSFQVSEGLGNGRYLGMPSMVGRNKKAIFGYLRDQVWSRIQQWSGKHLSKARREVLIKSVAQEIPTHYMGTFLLPTTLGEEIQKMINSFWWGTNRRQRNTLAELGQTYNAEGIRRYGFSTPIWL